MAPRRYIAALVAVAVTLTTALVMPSTTTLVAAQSTDAIRQLWSAHECKDEEMVTLEVGSRKALVLVHKLAAPFFTALHEIMADYEWSPDPETTGGFMCRDNVSVAKKSLHAFGIAADYDWEANAFQRSSSPPETNINPLLIVDVETKIMTNEGKSVFRWGGNWKDKKSAMHFEVVLGPDELAKGIGEYKLTDTGRRLLGARRAARLAQVRRLLADNDPAATTPPEGTTPPEDTTTVDTTPANTTPPSRDKKFNLGDTFRDLFKSAMGDGEKPSFGSLLNTFLGSDGKTEAGSGGRLRDVVRKATEAIGSGKPIGGITQLLGGDDAVKGLVNHGLKKLKDHLGDKLGDLDTNGGGLNGLLDKVADQAKKHLSKLGDKVDKHAGEGASAGPLDLLNGILDRFTNHAKKKLGKGGAGSILDAITGIITGDKGDGKGGGKLIDTIKDLFGQGDVGGNIKNAVDLFFGNTDGIVDKLKDVKVLGKLFKDPAGLKKLIETFKGKGKLADKIEAVSGLFGPKVRQHKEHIKSLAESISKGDFKGSLGSILGLIKKFKDQKDDTEVDVPDDIVKEEGTDADIPKVSKCSEFKWCPHSHFTLKDGEGSGCTTGTCTKEDCCGQRQSCGSFSCPATFKAKPGHAKLCAGVVCTTNECCVAASVDDKVVGSCNDVQCASNRAAKTGGKCAGATCLEDECCDPPEPITVDTGESTGFGKDFHLPEKKPPPTKKYTAPNDGRMTKERQSTEDEEVDADLVSFPLYKAPEIVNEPITDAELALRKKAAARKKVEAEAASADDDNAHVVMIIGVVMGVIFAVVAVGVVIRMRQKHVAQQNEFHAWQNNVYDQKQQAAHAAAAAADNGSGSAGSGGQSPRVLPGSLANYDSNPASMTVAMHTGTDTQNFYRQSRLYSDIPPPSASGKSSVRGM